MPGVNGGALRKMENLSVREFMKVCDSLSPKQFIFSSENQAWNKVEHTIKMKLTFTMMLIALNPNVIFLKNDENNFLYLDRVKIVKTSDEDSVLGDVFTIICGDSANSLNDVEYTIIVR